MASLAVAYTTDEHSRRENGRLLGTLVGGAGAPIIHAVWRQEDLAVVGTVSRLLFMGVGWWLGSSVPSPCHPDAIDCTDPLPRGREVGLAVGLTLATALDLTILLAR